MGTAGAAPGRIPISSSSLMTDLVTWDWSIAVDICSAGGLLPGSTVMVVAPVTLGALGKPVKFALVGVGALGIGSGGAARLFFVTVWVASATVKTETATIVACNMHTR